jgi:hypothetical protein
MIPFRENCQYMAATHRRYGCSPSPRWPDYCVESSPVSLARGILDR